MKHTKNKLLSSIATLIVCFAMLIGSTYAWFTDSASTGVNRIQAGNLDIEVEHTNAAGTTTSIDGATDLFLDSNGNEIVWEPGAVAYETFKVSNKGNLALKYKLKLHINDYNAVIDEAGVARTLKDVLKVKVLSGDTVLSTIDRDTVHTLGWTSSDPTLDTFSKSEGKLYPTGSTEGISFEEFQVIVYWMPSDADNYWNVNNGKTTTDGEPLFIDFGIDVAATQLEHENDSFDNTYDKDLIIADLPKSISKKFESTQLVLPSGTDEYNISESVQVKNKSTNEVVATMPGEAATAVGNALKDTITDRAEDSDLKTTIIFDIQTTSATSNSVVYNIEASAIATYKDTSGVQKTKEFSQSETDAALTTAGKITEVPLQIGMGLTSVSVTHNGTEMNVLSSAIEDAEGYFYNPMTGELVIKSITFSPFGIGFDSTSEVVATVNGQNYAKLEYALLAAQNIDNPVITVRKPVDEKAVFDKPFESKTVTLDLGGNSISGFTALAGTINVKNGTITGRTNAYDSSKVTIEADATVNNYIVVWGDGTYGTSGCKTPTLNMYGTVNNNTEYAAITTNGTDSSKPIINVYDGANVTSSDIAVYLPSGVMTVTGGSITGSTGIYFKSTDLSISGGTITGNGTKTDYDYNGNGAIATGDSLVIDNCNYPAGIGTVSVTGGTFVSVNAKAVGSYAGNGQTKALSGFITGGSFTDKPEYLALEYKAVLSDNYYSVVLCEEHHYVSGKCEYCGKLQETWLNIENAMDVAPVGFSISGNNITISTNNGFAWFAKQVNDGIATYANNSNLNVTLSDSIDLLDYPWTPINGFTGTFDGKNFTISNVNVNGDISGNGYGLFGASNAKSYKNLIINNVKVTGNSAIGALVGRMFTGTVDNIHVKGNILVGINTQNGYIAHYNSSYAGGIVGHGYATISNCSVIGNDGSTIGHGRQVGGIYGFSGEGQFVPVQNCKVENVTIIGTKSIGGILGWAHYGNSIKNCSVKDVTLKITNTDSDSIGFITGTTNSEDCNASQFMEMIGNTVQNSSIYVKNDLYSQELTLNTLYAKYGMGDFYVTDGNDYVFFSDYNKALSYSQTHSNMELKFTSFNSKISIAADGDVIEINEDCNLPRIELKQAKTVTIDLKGHTIHDTGADVFLVKTGKLIIQDSAGGGTIIHEGNDDLVWLQENGILEIRGGTFNFKTKYGIVYGTGNVVISGGSFSFDPEYEDNIKEYMSDGSSITINGALFTKS